MSQLDLFSGNSVGQNLSKGKVTGPTFKVGDYVFINSTIGFSVTFQEDRYCYLTQGYVTAVEGDKATVEISKRYRRCLINAGHKVEVITTHWFVNMEGLSDCLIEDDHE